MGIEGFFKDIGFGRKGWGQASNSGPSAAANLHPTIIAELRRLDLYRKGTADAAIRYVASGSNSSITDTIKAFEQAVPRYQSPYHKDSQGRTQTLSNTAAAFIKGEVLPGPHVARLLEIRIATGEIKSGWSQNLSHRELILMGLSETLGWFPDAPIATQADCDADRWSTVATVPVLFEHFRQVSGTGVDFFLFLFSKAWDNRISANRWLNNEEVARLFSVYPAEAAEALKQRKRMDAVKLLEYHGATALPEIEAALVAMLTKPFGKADRELASSGLAKLEQSQLLALIERELPKGDVNTRLGLVQAAGRCRTPQLLALLANRQNIEKGAKVKVEIDAILEALAPEPAAAPSQGEQAQDGYAAIDGSFISIPARKDIGVDGDTTPTDEACIAFVEIIEKFEQDRKTSHEQWCAENPNTRYPREAPKPFSRDEIETCFRELTEGVSGPGQYMRQLSHYVLCLPDGTEWYRAMLDRLPLISAIRLLEASKSGGVERLIGHTYCGNNGAERFGVNLLQEWIEQDRIELRDLDNGQKLRWLLHKTRSHWDKSSIVSIVQELPSKAVWPWVAENMAVLDEGFGLQTADSPIPVGNVMEALTLLPKVPQRYFAKLLDIAVSEKRPLRRQAMALLRGAKDLVSRIEQLLDDKRQDVRINSAVWLADLRSVQSEAVLRKRLKKEKSDPVKAALIESLQRLGADLNDIIGPASLIAEAEAACAKSAPNLPGWLAANGLPVVRFRDGSTVPVQLVQYWLALAIRLKDPGANGQFGIYLDQLAPADAQTLSNWILESWVSYDTQTSMIEDANAYALANYMSDWRWQYHQQTSELKNKIIAELIREKTGELLNSGSDTKGMLALACRADPVWAANRVRWFLKKHGRRSNQAMALLEALAGTGQAAALQVVIAASVRLKQKSTQARAAEIARRYAEDRGWSFDELADRTVPSAGFDDDGTMELPCGEDEKLYTARLDSMLAIHLFNPDGKTIKSFPAGDDEATKESKKAFSTAKKELAQVIELQRGRLFEAMCVERNWKVADWRLAFHEHPVMRRLIERLVWQGMDEGGNPLGLFRPTQEGDFTDAADNAVEIDSFAALRLAHGTLVDEATCQAWIAHLKDYEVKPFITQFDMLRAPLTAEQAEEEAIFDRQGWKADSLTYRSASEKRGYQRIMRDGGGCNEYEKKFSSHGITATIFHTGSYAVDENNQVALKELRFTKQGYSGVYRLKDVPPVMLAECWADYHTIAAKGVFDPDWEKIAPW